MSKIIALCGLLFFPLAVADDAGAEKAQACVVCHGVAGNVPIANYPKLAGQSEKYLHHTLKSYKDGSRVNAVMAAQMAALSDEDIDDLAAYFAKQKGDLQ